MNSVLNVEGIPLPYTMRSDNAITIILLLCFVVVALSIAHSRRFFLSQLSKLFYTSYSDRNQSETSGEVRFQLSLIIVHCLLLGIASFYLASEITNATFSVDSHALIVLMLSGLALSYFLSKGMMEWMVNITFFGGKKSIQWFKISLFLASFTALLIFPMVLLQVYFDLSIEKSAIYFIFVLILNKLITIYQCWKIFFKQRVVFLQTFLYFCALEIVPLAVASGLGMMLIDNLKVNI